MHLLNIATVFVMISLVGVEFSIAAFVDPSAWRLHPEPQLKLLSRMAFVLGKVMPVWYPVSGLLLGIQTWMSWKTSERDILLTATVVWVTASVGSIVFLVPLNTRVANGDADWQRVHRVWDKRHRVRTAALAIAAIMALYAVVR